MKKHLLLSLIVSFGVLTTALAQPKDEAAKAEPADQQALFKQFEETMSGVKMVGRFTITGKDSPPAEEEYTINKVTKLDEGDYWMFIARIKYGDKDYTVPLPLQVKWAEDTPVITLTNLKILGQGPFSARVVIHEGKYAGTWSHGEVGGHLFGKIVKIEEDKPDTPKLDE